MLLSTAPVDAELGVKLHGRMTVGLDASRAVVLRRRAKHETVIALAARRNGSLLRRPPSRPRFAWTSLRKNSE